MLRVGVVRGQIYFCSDEAKGEATVPPCLCDFGESLSLSYDFYYNCIGLKSVTASLIFL